MKYSLSSLTSAIVFFPLIVLLLQSCEYKQFDEVHPITVPCDTTDTITYNQTIKPIMIASCGSTNLSCHIDGGVQINLNQYNEIKDAADDGSLLGSILHQPGYEPMPLGGAKLDECTINTIIAWVNRGEPEN